MLADKTFSPEAQRARKLRDAAYTLVVHAERRLRAAAEYWYAGTDKMKDYAPFPVSRGAASTGEEEEEEEGEAAAEDGAPEGDASEVDATEDGAPGEGEDEG
ncbi:hypothetical protein [Sorangium sp. So ce385]|uniref:hypothetical protein n=1 Tax=Sorangium sp. So ce385 TaxID=3133308 RepID=UPI003F5C5190